MPKAIRLHATGGTNVLQFQEVGAGDTAMGSARVRHHAVGVNFIDIYHRTGLYPLSLPSGIRKVRASWRLWVPVSPR